MPSSLCSLPRLGAGLLVLVLALGCAGEPATAPESPLLGRGKPRNPDLVRLENVSLSSVTLQLEGGGTLWAADIVNDGGKLQLATLQGYITQRDADGNIIADRPAGGLGVFCDQELATLAHGTCHVEWPFSVSNSTPGIGTLVPGSAHLLIEFSSKGNLPETNGWNIELTQ